MDTDSLATTPADIGDYLAEDLISYKAMLLRLETEAEKTLAMIRNARQTGIVSGWDAVVYQGGTVTLFDAERQLMLLLDKVEAINASFNYGTLPKLIEESGHDPIPF